MAAKRMRESIDYQQLNMLSSIVLYNERKKRKTGKLYEAERIIERRNKGRVHFPNIYVKIYLQVIILLLNINIPV
jgi:hypothetical protein